MKQKSKRQLLEEELSQNLNEDTYLDTNDKNRNNQNLKSFGLDEFALRGVGDSRNRKLLIKIENNQQTCRQNYKSPLQQKSKSTLENAFKKSLYFNCQNMNNNKKPLKNDFSEKIHQFYYEKFKDDFSKRRQTRNIDLNNQEIMSKLNKSSYNNQSNFGNGSGSNNTVGVKGGNLQVLDENSMGTYETQYREFSPSWISFSQIVEKLGSEIGSKEQNKLKHNKNVKPSQKGNISNNKIIFQNNNYQRLFLKKSQDQYANNMINKSQ